MGQAARAETEGDAVSLFDLQPLTIEQVRANQDVNEGETIRRNGRTIRHKPWWMLVGPGPVGATCRTCAHLRRKDGQYFKCGLHAITSGTGTDIRAKDAACSQFNTATPC